MDLRPLWRRGRASIAPIRDPRWMGPENREIAKAEKRETGDAVRGRRCAQFRLHRNCRFGIWSLNS
jgi:hypothetical protein